MASLYNPPRLLDLIYSTKRKVIIDYLLRMAISYNFNRRTLHLTMIYYDVYAQKINRLPTLNIALVCLYLASGMADTTQFDLRGHYERRGAAAEAPAVLKSLDLLIQAVLEKLEYRLYWKTLVEKIVSHAIQSDRTIDRTKQDLYIATLTMMEPELSIIPAASVSRRIRIITDCLFDGKDFVGLLRDNISHLVINAFQSASKLPNLAKFCLSRAGNCTIVPYACPEMSGSVGKHTKTITTDDQKLFANCLTPRLLSRLPSFFNRTEYLYDLGSGTFGIVGAVQVDGKKYALKKAVPRADHLLYLREVNNCAQVLGDERFVQMDSMMYNPRPGGVRCYLWFELAETDLHDILKHETLDAETRVQFIADLIEGVVSLHQKGIVHRDLTSKNILIQNGRIKIADLGSAKIVYPSLETDEIESFYSYPELSVCVCAAYTRPIDVIFGNKFYSYDFDVWSVGCLIYWILTGEPLFYGNDEDEIIDSVYQTLGIIGTERFTVLPNYVAPDPDLELNSKMDDFKRRFPSFAEAVSKALLYHGNSRPSITELREMIFGDQG